MVLMTRSCDRSNPARQAQLRLDLAKRTIGGRELDQLAVRSHRRWPNLVCPDPQKMVVLTTYAGVRHPRTTDK